MMFLKAHKLDIMTSNRNIAIIDDDTARKFDLHPDDRVTLKSGQHEITAILDISRHSVPRKEIGLFIGTFEALHVKEGAQVKITPIAKPESINYIKEKLNGQRLNSQKLDMIVKDIVADKLADMEMAYFVAGCYINTLNDQETADLTRAIVRNGSRLHFKDKIVVDKHCIGGIPNNRTTMIVVPILTALGLKMPKTSSRSITSPAGTADTMEVLANVTNDAKTLQKIANKIGGFITWGGGVDLAAADDHMIRVRHPLSLDPEGMLLASIMAKKYSVSANHVFIDIPLGPEAKVVDKKSALHLKSRFLKIAKLLGMKARVLISDGTQPIGNGVGPLLEALDVLKILKNEKDAPIDLREKSLKIASILLELTKKAKAGQGYKMAQKCLQDGRAWKQMQLIIKEQGEKKIQALAKNTCRIFGWVNNMHEFMKASNIIITKAGGAITMECIAVQKPIIITEVIAGQEEGNAKLIKKYKIGYIAETPIKIITAINNIQKNPKQIQKNLAKLFRPKAAENIAKFVKELVEK